MRAGQVQTAGWDASVALWFPVVPGVAASVQPDFFPVYRGYQSPCPGRTQPQGHGSTFANLP